MTDGEKLFGRPVLGGLAKGGFIIDGTPEDVTKAVEEVLADATEGRVMIGSDCTVSAVPVDNLHAAVAAAHKNTK